MAKKVVKTRNLNTWTEAQFWGRIRSALRRVSMYYKPIQEAKNRARKTVTGKRHKFEYQCASCKKWYVAKEINVDHKIPAGSLRNADDLKGFVERLFCENPDGYQILCKTKKTKNKITHYGCHDKKTSEQRKS